MDYDEMDALDRWIGEHVMHYEWVPYWKTIRVFDGEDLLADIKERHRLEHAEREENEEGSGDWCWAIKEDDGHYWKRFSDWDPEDPTAVWQPTRIMDHALMAIQAFGMPWSLECIGSYKSTISGPYGSVSVVHESAKIATCLSLKNFIDKDK